MTKQTILRIDASPRGSDTSISRKVADRLIDRLTAATPGVELVSRDGLEALPLVTSDFVVAYNTPAEDHDENQQAANTASLDLVQEVQEADALVIATPMYNFSVPAALKAWIDLVCRAGHTFKYTPDGPVGLLEGKTAYVVIATGGTPVGSGYDHLSGYMRHVLGFIGITDVHIIPADTLMRDADAAIARADAAIEACFADQAA
ncbi:MAG: FMN-dependent NADH-azoreductase [Magnetovibrionaceae bacterium]